MAIKYFTFDSVNDANKYSFEMILNETNGWQIGSSWLVFHFPLELTLIIPEHNIAQFGVIYEFWIDSRTVGRLQNGLFDQFDWFPAKACGKYIG